MMNPAGRKTLAMMEQMKQRMSSGQSGQQQGPQAGQKPPQGGQQQGPQTGQQARPSQAEQLKTSLEGVRLSAEYLKNSKFVK